MENSIRKYETADPILYPLLLKFALENRNHQTYAERELWRHLSHNQLGLHFRRQHIISRYIADFVCLRRMLIIEVDGGYHAQEQQIIEDYLRTEDLARMGFTVLRFRNEEILNDMSHTLDTIFNSFFL